MFDQGLAQQRQALQPHVDDDGLVVAGDAFPVEVESVVAQVAGDEGDRLRVVAVGQRDARIRRHAGGGGDAGHHLERHAVLDQGFDFLAAAAEDEGIAALQAQGALAFLGEAHQQQVDLLLRHGMVVALLADVDALGIAPAHVEDGLRYQAVVDDDVGLLHQTQGAEGQQVRISGTGADEVDLAAADVMLGALADHFPELLFCLDVASGEHHFGDRGEEDLFPEGTPLGRLDHIAHALLVARGQRAQATVGGGNQGFQPGPQHACQHRRFAAAGNRDHDRRAVDDRGQDEAAQFGLVRDVDRYMTRARCVDDAPGIVRIVLDDDHQVLAVEQVRTEGVGHALQVFGMRQACKPFMQGGRGDIDQGAGTQQQFGLARSSLGASHQQAAAITDIEEDRQKIHGFTQRVQLLPPIRRKREG